MRSLLEKFFMWRESRARDAEAKWANRRYWLDPAWRRSVRR